MVRESAPPASLGLIGNTPLVRLNGFDTGPCEVFLKLENRNPGGSIKDRMAVSMIEAAERTGKLRPGQALMRAADLALFLPGCGRSRPRCSGRAWT